MKIDEVKYASTYELISEVRQLNSENKPTIAKVLIGILKERASQLAMEIEILKSRPATTSICSLISMKSRERNNINEFVSKHEQRRQNNRNA